MSGRRKLEGRTMGRRGKIVLRHDWFAEVPAAAAATCFLASSSRLASISSLSFKRASFSCSSLRRLACSSVSLTLASAASSSRSLARSFLSISSRLELEDAPRPMEDALGLKEAPRWADDLIENCGVCGLVKSAGATRRGIPGNRGDATITNLPAPPCGGC